MPKYLYECTIGYPLYYLLLKPGGKVVILEFSKPLLPLLNQLYDQYSFKVLPLLGKIIANDAESYRYLAESIRKHPDQQALKQMMLSVGFDKVVYHHSLPSQVLKYPL